MDRLDELEAFVAVAEAGSFVAAARRLGRSPAALTRGVAALERRLGTRLFTRTTRVVSLTQGGRRQLAPCQEILRSIAALASTAAEERREASGSLRITASVVFGRLHVRPVVTDLLQRLPAVDVQLILADEVLSLVDERIDAGVRIAHLPDSTLKAVRAGSVRRGLYASPAYLTARGEPETLADLARHSTIAFTGGAPSPIRWTFGGRGAKRSVTITPRLAVNLAEPAIDAAVAGHGITRVLSYMVDHLVEAGALRPILRAFEPPAIPVHVVYPAGRHLPLATREFVDLAVPALRAKFERH